MKNNVNKEKVKLILSAIEVLEQFLLNGAMSMSKDMIKNVESDIKDTNSISVKIPGSPVQKIYMHIDGENTYEKLIFLN